MQLSTFAWLQAIFALCSWLADNRYYEFGFRFSSSFHLTVKYRSFVGFQFFFLDTKNSSICNPMLPIGGHILRRYQNRLKISGRNQTKDKSKRLWNILAQCLKKGVFIHIVVYFVVLSYFAFFIVITITFDTWMHCNEFSEFDSLPCSGIWLQLFWSKCKILDSYQYSIGVESEKLNSQYSSFWTNVRRKKFLFWLRVFQW